MMLKESVIFFISCLVFLCDSTEFYTCMPRNLLDIHLGINNCLGPVCEIKNGTNVSMNQTFVPNREIRVLESLALTYSTREEPIFYRIDDGTACDRMYHKDGSKASCPLKSGTGYVFKANFKWPAPEPGEMILQWVLLDEDEGQYATCFFIRVVDKLQWTLSKKRSSGRHYPDTKAFSTNVYL